MRHKWVYIGVLAALLVVAAGYASMSKASTSTAGSSKAVSGSVSIVGVWSGAEQKAFQAVLNGFKKKFPNVKVTYKSTGDNTPTVLVDGGGRRQPARSRIGVAAGPRQRLPEEGRAQEHRLREGRAEEELPGRHREDRRDQGPRVRPPDQGRQQVDHLVQRRRVQDRRRQAARRRGQHFSRPRTR